MSRYHHRVLEGPSRKTMVCIDVDGNVGVVERQGGVVICSAGLVKKVRSGWHAYPLDSNGRYSSIPTYFPGTQAHAITYLLRRTAYDTGGPIR